MNRPGPDGDSDVPQKLSMSVAESRPLATGSRFGTSSTISTERLCCSEAVPGTAVTGRNPFRVGRHGRRRNGKIGTFWRVKTPRLAWLAKASPLSIIAVTAKMTNGCDMSALGESAQPLPRQGVKGKEGHDFGCRDQLCDTPRFDRKRSENGPRHRMGPSKRVSDRRRNIVRAGLRGAPRRLGEDVSDRTRRGRRGCL